jgi:DNA mismatch endonuclease, patch repair protein
VGQRASYRPKPHDEIRRNMSAIRSKENKTEVALGLALHRMGFRYRKYRSDLPGCPDIAFLREKVAVFVDGDYWHGRILIDHGARALSRALRTRNRAYWMMKLRGNVDRDRAATELLLANGWRVLRFWESDVKHNIEAYAKRVATAVARRHRHARS